MCDDRMKRLIRWGAAGGMEWRLLSPGDMAMTVKPWLAKDCAYRTMSMFNAALDI